MSLQTRAALLAVTALMAAACGSGSDDAAKPQRRTVQVDYKHDEFATSLFDYFPRRIEVRQGDTVEFKQAWAGEPHSVTMGTLVDDNIEPVLRLLTEIERTGTVPEEEPEEFGAFGEAVPYAFAEEGLAQNAAQPCYVDAEGFDGTYPGDEKTPCPNRAQPEFTGRQAVYNSGIIPYEGVQGNTFSMKVADDATPGTYTYYCNFHGPLQWGQVEVKQKGAEIPAAGEVARQARKEAERKVAPLLHNWKEALAGRPVTAGDPGQTRRVETRGKNLVGVPTEFFVDNTFIFGIVNEFVPRDLSAKVGEKVTWTFGGGHTLSFNVPEYFPVFSTAPDGTVSFNKEAEEPQGWPAPPDPPGVNGGEPPERVPAHVDAGAWDGSGFRSSGLAFDDDDTLSVTFTRAGTYPFACLIHPQMIGQLVVR
ncbi:MAG: hypothetical protein KY450_04155 [Actinobacteria bacterium]|nr:hypothetical protein [Actinomycetota bacterium]